MASPVQPSGKSGEILCFGSYELDARAGQLHKHGVKIKLQEQPLQVLTYLVEHAGQVVTREELQACIWPADTFVDFDQGLNRSINKIRAALNDDAVNPRFVETLSRRGYRFLAPVFRSAQLQHKQAQREQDGANSGAALTPASADRPRRIRWFLAACASLLLAAALLLLAWNGAKSKTQPHVQSLAVLPLENLSGDSSQEYLADGMTDELTTQLAKIGSIRVISRTSSMHYRGTQKPLPEIARELNVDAVVEGSVARDGNRIRIRAQLIQGSTDQHLWAESYDRDVSDLFRLEGDVARDIAAQIGQLSVEQRSPATQSRSVSPAAHEDYLKGRYYWNKRTEAGLRKGIEYFQKAIAEDPNYAPAYAGLADSYIMLANWSLAPPGEAYPKAKAAALKALELDSRLAEAHTSLAYTTLLYEWDWQSAEKRFQQAIALNPNYASAHHFYSICLMTAGRQSEALAEIQRAQELDPLSLIINDVYGWIYYEGRQYDRAIQQYMKTLEMDPGYVPALLDLGTSYMRTGKYPEAIAQFEKARSVGGETGVVLSGLAQAYAFSGQSAKALEILRRLQQPSAPIFVSTWDLSLIYVALGEKAKAIALLEKCADEHVGWVVRFAVDPAFDSLRTEPQFEKLKRRVGIPRAS